jgi:hypothetical protein
VLLPGDVAIACGFLFLFGVLTWGAARTGLAILGQCDDDEDVLLLGYRRGALFARAVGRWSMALALVGLLLDGLVAVAAAVV